MDNSSPQSGTLSERRPVTPASIADVLSDEALARYARTRSAFTRVQPPLPKSSTVERGAGHKLSNPDGDVYVDHAGCPSREVPQFFSARKRNVFHRERRGGARLKVKTLADAQPHSPRRLKCARKIILRRI